MHIHHGVRSCHSLLNHSNSPFPDLSSSVHCVKLAVVPNKNVIAISFSFFSSYLALQLLLYKYLQSSQHPNTLFPSLLCFLTKLSLFLPSLHSSKSLYLGSTAAARIAMFLRSKEKQSSSCDVTVSLKLLMVGKSVGSTFWWQLLIYPMNDGIDQ